MLDDERSVIKASLDDALLEMARSMVSRTGGIATAALGLPAYLMQGWVLDSDVLSAVGSEPARTLSRELGIPVSVDNDMYFLGSWLSFTMLPAETTSEMAASKLLPASWGKLNSKGAPQLSLVVVGACTQAFLIVLLVSEDAYDFAYSMCTVAIVITWALAAAYQVKSAHEANQGVQLAIGLVATVFFVVGVVFNGWSYLLLTCVGYIPGFVVYVQGRKSEGLSLGAVDKAGIAVITALGVLALVLLAMGVITL